MEVDMGTQRASRASVLRELALLAALPALVVQAQAQAPPRQETSRAELLVYAAASLTDVLQRIGADYTRQRGTTVKFSFGGTSTLARQLESGARPDVFVSADEEWMNYVDARKLIVHDSRVDLLGNRLVLIAPADRPTVLAIAPAFRLREALGAQGRLSVADPAAVPAGRYARAALTTLGVWDSVADRLATSENVRTAMLYVARGEAPLGIVYATDAKSEPKVRIVGEFPADTHPPIRYPAAVTSHAGPQAADFLAYLQSDAAQAKFSDAGFDVIAPAAAQHQPEIASRSR
jgi:molybdate transport system substrate-binding protein